MIGDDVTLTVLGVRGNQVHTGVQAPRQIVINREEIHRRIRREQELERRSGAAADRRPSARGPTCEARQFAWTR